MRNPQENWERLVKTARQTPEAPVTEAPYGFATRVVARWQTAPPPSMLSVWEMLSRRILTVACIAMFLCLALNAAFLHETLNENDPIAAAQDGLDITLIGE